MDSQSREAAEGLRPFNQHDIARIASRYAYGAANVNGTDFTAEVHRFLAWVTLMQNEATRDAERMVQDLENENARLMQELIEAEAAL